MRLLLFYKTYLKWQNESLTKIIFSMDLHQFLITEKKKNNVFYVIKFLASFIETIKLKFHLEKFHPNYKDKDVNFFKQRIG